MIYVIFYNPECGHLSCDTIKNYHEIMYYTILRGFKPSEFKIIDHRFCASKNQSILFEDLIKSKYNFEASRLKTNKTE